MVWICGAGTMPSYKLSYFDGRGRAEPARYLFAYTGTKYTDVRVTQEEWPALKPSRFKLKI